MAEIIDLRSDTVTLPSPAMREAMYKAEVGDDVFGEDPTVRKLEELGAERFGKEAGLFVASGTMGNLVAQLTHCGRGEEIILGADSHIFYYEVGGGSALGGLVYHTLENERDGYLYPAKVEGAIRLSNIHFPKTGLICLENTHNRRGGTVLTVAQMNTIGEIGRKHQIPLHLDGARIFNAAIALEVPVSELTATMTTVQFCLSKGLAAPVGSILVGPAEFITRARQIRKMLGGGMRQAGILAAAGLVALNDMVERLAEDHHNAQSLAEGLTKIKGIELELKTVQTNVVIFSLGNEQKASSFLQACAKEGLLGVSMGGPLVRFITHYGITGNNIEAALQICQKISQA